MWLGDFCWIPEKMDCTEGGCKENCELEEGNEGLGELETANYVNEAKGLAQEGAWRLPEVQAHARVHPLVLDRTRGPSLMVDIICIIYAHIFAHALCGTVYERWLPHPCGLILCCSLRVRALLCRLRMPWECAQVVLG